MPTPIKHGTQGGYTNRKCRCDLCRAANTAYQRVNLPKWRAKRRAAGLPV
jgi:predicted secreted Zn-dependent protease